MYRLYLFATQKLEASVVAERLGNQFEVNQACYGETLGEINEIEAADAFVLYLDQNEADCLEYCEALHQHAGCEHVPIIIVSQVRPDTDQRLAAYQRGCTEWVSLDYGDDVIVTRINKEIFHKIADGQLRTNLDMANQMAFQAMSDTSDLGITVQFLLESGTAQNVDALGQQF